MSGNLFVSLFIQGVEAKIGLALLLLGFTSQALGVLSFWTIPFYLALIIIVSSTIISALAYLYLTRPKRIEKIHDRDERYCNRRLMKPTKELKSKFISGLKNWLHADLIGLISSLFGAILVAVSIGQIPCFGHTTYGGTTYKFAYVLHLKLFVLGLGFIILGFILQFYDKLVSKYSLDKKGALLISLCIIIASLLMALFFQKLTFILGFQI